MKKLLKFRFKGKDLVLYKGMYLMDKRPALVIREIINSCEKPYATLSVYLEGKRPIEGEFHIKTWSENKKIADHLRNRHPFEDTGKRIRYKYVEIEVWKLREKLFSS